MWVPRYQSPLTLREEHSQGGSCARCAPTFTFQMGSCLRGQQWSGCPGVNVTPRRPLGLCPIRTSYSDQTSCSKSTLTLTPPVCPWPVWLILGSEPLGTSKPKGTTQMALCSPLFPIPTRREDSQTRIPSPCSAVFLPFLRLFHLPSMKSNRNPLLSAHFGTLTWEISKEVIPSTTPSPSSWRNWGCWGDKEA